MEWISVDEDAPEAKEIVLVCDEISGVVTLAKYLPKIFEDFYEDFFYVMSIDYLEEDYCVTHWMRRPTPPTRRVEE